MHPSYIVDLNESNFSQIIESSLQTPLLVHFWSNQEPSSVDVIPSLNTLAHQYDGAFTLALLNCEEQLAIAHQFGVQALPTIALFISGQPVDGLGGPQPLEAIQAMLNKHLPSPEIKKIEQANALIAEQQYESAQLLLDVLSDEYKQQPAVKLMQADCLIASHQIDEAKALIDTIPLEYRDNYYHGLIAKIDLHQQAADSPELKQLEIDFANNPSDFTIRSELATQYHQVGRHEEAMALLWESLTKDLNANNGEVKKHFMDLLNALGQGHALTSKYRRLLYSMMY